MLPLSKEIAQVGHLAQRRWMAAIARRRLKVHNPVATAPRTDLITQRHYAPQLILALTGNDISPIVLLLDDRSYGLSTCIQ